MGVSARSLSAGKAVIRLSLLSDGIDAQLRKLESQMKAFGGKMQSIGKAMFAPAAAIGGSLGAAALTFASVGSELDDMSKRTGASVAMLSELKFAADQSGTSLSAIEKALRFMQKSGQGADQFYAVAESIRAIQDPVAKTQAAMAAWGVKTGPMLIPMLDDLTALRAEAQKLGLVMSDEDAAAAAKLDDAFAKVKMQFTALVTNIGGAVAGEMTDFTNWVSEMIPKMIDWVKENKQLIVDVGKVTSVVGLAGGAIMGLGTFCITATPLVKGLGVALEFASANPIVLGFAAIAAVLYTVGEAFEDVADKAADAQLAIIAASSPKVPNGTTGEFAIPKNFGDGAKRIEAAKRGQAFNYGSAFNALKTGLTGGVGAMGSSMSGANQKAIDQAGGYREEAMRLQDEIKRAQIANMEDEHQRALAMIMQEKDERLRALQASGLDTPELRASLEALAEAQRAGLDAGGNSKVDAAQRESQAVFDTRFASQQFGGPMVDLLAVNRKIEKNTRNKAAGGLPVV